MKYFLLSLRLSLRRSMGSVRFWCALLLVLALGAAVRGVLRPSAEAAVQVGAVIPAGGEAFREALDGFLAALPERDRNLFLRRYWYLDSTEQLAKRFRMSRTHVTTALHRLRQKLRAHLEQEGFEL